MVPAWLCRKLCVGVCVCVWFGDGNGIGQVNVLSYDYRGYGLHPGVPTEASCYADVEGAYDLLTKEFKIPPSRIILYTNIIVISALSACSALTLTPLVSLSTPLDFRYGRSIGSGPTCYLGQRLCALARAQSRPSSWLSPSMFCRGVPSGYIDTYPVTQ